MVRLGVFSGEFSVYLSFFSFWKRKSEAEKVFRELIMHAIGKPRACRREGASGVLIVGCLVFLWVVGTVSSLSADGNALLEFKRSVTSDPLRVFLNWNESDEDPCSWTGVVCNLSSRRVVTLNIKGQSDFGSASLFSPEDGLGEGSKGRCSRFLGSASKRFLARVLLPESNSVGNDSMGSSMICLRNGSVVNSWEGYNGQDRVACKLAGTLSSSIGHLSELRVLSLPFNAFSGDVPSEIGNLTFLEVLELQGNSFTGQLPSELGSLKFLRILNLGYNSLVRAVPEELSNCRILEILDLAGNGLNGSIPVFLGGLTKLKALSLSFNQFSGSIPLELANSCQLLEYLDLSGNLLTDKIPPQLMNCSRLVSLALFSNFLEGSIPSEIGRLSMLQILDVSRNSLTGKIPKELADCRQLSVLVLSNLLNFDPGNDTDVDQSSVFFTNSDKGEYNYFEGIPASIFTLPQLQIIWAPKTSLNGPLPENWDNCNLQVLNLGQNLLTGQIPAGLGQCKNLFFLDLSSSHLTGEIPQELRISCLIYFDVSHNSLTGNFTTAVNADCPKQPLFPGNQFEEGLSNVSQSELDPPTIYSSLLYCGTCASSSLRFLVSEGLPVLHDFSGNNFTGSIPPPLIGDQMIKEQASYALLLNDNNFTGNITSSLFNLCARLQTFALNMSVNQISGEIPPELFVNCKSLKHFEAAVNQITGPLPSTLGNLESLMHLDLRNNSLHGSIPTQFGQLKDLRYLSLGENNLTGEIPGLLGQISLTVLELYSNAFTGKIPANLINLKQLTRLRLDNNKLTGQVPQGFANLTSLTVFNVSYNNLSGPLPQFSSKISCDSFTGNNLLQSCVSELAPSQQEQDQVGVPLPYALSPSGNPVDKHNQFNSIEIAAITSAAAIVSVVLVLAVLFQCTRWHIPSSAGYRSRRREVITFTNIGVQLTYESVVRATGNFSAANFIGNGGFGATYKAELIPGLLVAVKRLSVGRFQGIQQFDAEIRTLGRARHPNLVTLIGYHVSESQMFLVYNYLPGGNLEKFLQERSKRRVDWSMIHKIALDIARALTYLHEDCVPRVLHRDIKPSNILLDNNFNAYLSDFGLARLLGTSETHATTDVAGTFGYVAPEYAMTCRVSDKADVYSYGVVLLELLSDKKALDPSFSSYGNGFNIVAWACMLLRQGRARELFTAGLWDVGPHDDLIETLHLAVMCTVDSLSIRPSMKQVVQRLRRLQPPLLH